MQDLLVRDKIMEIQDKIAQLPGAMFGDCFPLKHKIIDGLYVREIFVPKGFSHSFLIYILILLILLFILLSHLLIGELSEGKYFTIIN